MQYQSIIRILEYCGVDCNTLDVAKTRKILAAEFSIAPGGIISIDGFDYTRNDVFNELEREDFTQRLETQLMIWKTPSLLDCLEKNVVDIRQIESWDWLRYSNNRQAIGFISPYFAVSFDKVMRKQLDPIYFKNADMWLKTLQLIDNAEDEHTALSGVRIFIADFIKILKNSNDVSYKYNLPVIGKWFSQPWWQFVDNLPDSFYNTRNELLSAMIDFMVVIQHKNQDLCWKMSFQMVKVTGIDPDLKKVIANNHRIINKIDAPETEELPQTEDRLPRTRQRAPQPKESSGRPVWLAIIPFIVIVLRLITTSNHSSTSYSTRNSYNDIFKEVAITNNFFNEQRTKYSVIDTSYYRGRFNQNLSVISNVPYYMIFEKKDTLKHVKVNFINLGTTSVTIYMSQYENLYKHELGPGKALHIEASSSAIDVLMSNMGMSGISFRPAPILISDALNLNIHRANLGDLVTVSEMSILEKEMQVDFTMLVGVEQQNGISTNIISFPGANWIY